MPERIFLTYTNATAVPYQGSVLGHHIVLNYIDANGAHHTLQGTPEHKFAHNIDKLLALSGEELSSDGVRNTDSPFQRLQVRRELIDTDLSLDQPHTIVAEGDDLSSRWALMQDFANEVNSIGYEYRPISQNSNSFAGGALQRAGFFGPGNEFPERFDRQLVFDPVSGESKSLRVPGVEAPLTSPIDTATPLPFPFDVPAAPRVPTNGVAAPARHGFLDNGFGNWGAVPASVQGAPGDKPVRYLGRRSHGISQGSAFDTSAPAVPLASPDGIAGAFGNAPSPMLQPQNSGGPLSLMDAYLQYRKRLDANQSRASAIDANAPAAPFVPSDDSNFSGGLLGRMAALMGVDPQNPNQFALPPLADGLREFYRNDPMQRFVQRQR
jgi:hypothetical protein